MAFNVTAKKAELAILTRGKNGVYAEQISPELHGGGWLWYAG